MKRLRCPGKLNARPVNRNQSARALRRLTALCAVLACMSAACSTDDRPDVTIGELSGPQDAATVETEGADNGGDDADIGAASSSGDADDASPVEGGCYEARLSPPPPPDGSGFLLGGTDFWGGVEDTRAVLDEAVGAAGEDLPVIWTGENLGIALTPMRGVSADDVASLIRRAAEREETSPRRVTITTELRAVEETLSGQTMGAGEDLADSNAAWIGAGAMGPAGSWFLDIARMEAEPAPLIRIGEIDGQALGIGSPLECEQQTLPEEMVGALVDDFYIYAQFDLYPDLDLSAGFNPYSGDGDSVYNGMMTKIDGSQWKEFLSAAIEPGGRALVNAARAETIPGVGDVYQIGILVDPLELADMTVFAQIIADQRMTGDMNARDAAVADWLLELDLFGSPIEVRYEIDGEGRLLTAEYDLPDQANEFLTVWMSLVELAFTADDELEIDNLPLPEPLSIIDKFTWRVTWRYNGEDFEVSSEAPAAWEMP